MGMRMTVTLWSDDEDLQALIEAQADGNRPTHQPRKASVNVAFRQLALFAVGARHAARSSRTEPLESL